MRKWLSSLGYTLAILGAILLILPLLFGFFAERKCKQMVETINTTTPLNTKIISYQRGWFSSEATTQLSLDKLDLPNKELYQLTINADIAHGPILIDWVKFYFVQAMIDANINLNTAQNSWLKREPKAEPVATVKIKFKLNGNTDLTLNSPPLNHQNPENNLNWYGLKIRSIYTPLYNQVKSKIDFAGIDIKTKDRSVHMGEITSNFQGNKTATGIWLGERNLHCRAFSTTNDNNHTISFDDLTIQSLAINSENSLANIATIINIANLSINGAIYNQNKLELEINKIDQTLLAKSLQQLISNKIISSPGGTLLDTVISILSNGSEINIKQLDTTTPWGKLITDIKVSFANQPNNDSLLAALANSTISSNIKVERALALHLIEKFYQNIPWGRSNDPIKQAETSLTKWQQSGKILTSNEDPYLRLTFDYKNHLPSINNKHLILTTTP